MFVKKFLNFADAGSPYIYFSHYERLSWHGARNHCRNFSHGDLASIHNMEELLKITQVINWKEKVWIGGYRERDGNKGFWTWSDKTLFDYPLGDIQLRNKCMIYSKVKIVELHIILCVKLIRQVGLLGIQTVKEII